MFNWIPPVQFGLYWTRFVSGDAAHEENAFSEETARAYIDAYQPVALTMKPFKEYLFG